ncbi:hypothetical protein TNCV_777771 [Trichonephila clavipes]|nr:hypothetical protein TNCV_777771 [Trichonephila clavipes]
MAKGQISRMSLAIALSAILVQYVLTRFRPNFEREHPGGVHEEKWEGPPRHILTSSIRRYVTPARVVRTCPGPTLGRIGRGRSESPESD